MKKSFQLYKDTLVVLDALTDEQKGQLFYAIYKYQIGEEVELEGIVKVAFSPLKAQFERDNEKYQEVCERNKKIASERWDTKSTTRTKSIPKVRSHADKDKDKDKDTIIYSQVISHLNKSSHKNYKSTSDKTRGYIDARLNDKFTLEDFIKVIDIKAKEWIGTDYEKFLRPETLFSNKFEGYLNQVSKTENNNLNGWK